MSVDEFDAMLEEEKEEKEKEEKKLEEGKETQMKEEEQPAIEEERTEEQKEKKEASKKGKREEKQKEKKEEAVVEKKEATPEGGHIYALRTTANREDQVMDFITSNVNKKVLPVFAIVRPHGMRGYIFIEAATHADAEQAAFNVPYARGILPNEIQYKEIEHMLEQVKQVINIEKGDIVELISGPFKREKAKITRIDKTKEEVVVELLEAAVPIPITVKLDAVKVIRREAAAEETTDEEMDE